MNIISMISEIRSSAHELNENFLNDEDIVRFINRGQRHIQKILAKKYEEIFHKSYSANIVSGTASYALPGDILANRIQKVELVKSDYIYPIERIPLRDTSNYDAQGSVSYPEFYCVIGSKIVFYPTPSSSLTDGIRIYYTQRFPNLGESMGQVENATVSSITVDSLTTDSTGAISIAAGDYINVTNQFDGLIKGSYLISSVDSSTEKITISTGFSLTLSSASITSSYFGFDSGDDLSNIRIEDSLVVSGTTALDATYTITLVDNTNKRIYVSATLAATDISGGSATITQGTYDGLTVSTSISGISKDNIVTKSPSVGVSWLPRTFHDYLTQFGLVEVLKKAKEPIEEEKYALEELEREIANTWQDRISTDKVKVTNREY